MQVYPPLLYNNVNMLRNSCFRGDDDTECLPDHTGLNIVIINVYKEAFKLSGAATLPLELSDRRRWLFRR